MSTTINHIKETFKRIINALLPTALLHEWPFLCAFSILSAPFPFYLIFRAITIPELWFYALKDILIVNFIAYLCARLIVSSNNRAIRRSLKILFYFIASVQFVTFAIALILFNYGICPDLFIVIIQTNEAEASSFIKTFLLPEIWLIIGLIISVISVISLLEISKKYFNKALFLKEHISIIKNGLLFCICAGLVFTIPFLKMFLLDLRDLRTWQKENSPYHKSIENNLLVCSMYSLTFVYRTFSQYGDWKDNQILSLKTIATTPHEIKADSLEIIFVIGESYIRSHSQLYGYSKPTAPRQLRELNHNNIVVFRDMASTAKITDFALSNILNLNSLSANEQWSDGVFFPITLNKAGWKIELFDNNAVGKNMFNFIANELLHSDLVNDSCFSKSVIPQTPEHDVQLVYDSFYTQDAQDAANRLAIYHLFAQHVPFNAIPLQGCDLFKATDYKERTEPWMDKDRKQLIADYDNATLANDSVMGMIYDHWRDKNAIVVYVSDHGEEVFDYHDSMGRKNRTDQTMEQYIESFFMVPATVWMSEKFMSLYPEKVEAIKRAASRPGTTDDIGHFIIGLAEISSPYYKPERDIASDRYQPVRRFTVEGFYIDSI